MPFIQHGDKLVYKVTTPFSTENEKDKLERELKQAIEYLIIIILPLRNNSIAKYTPALIDDVCDFIDKYYHQREPLEFKDIENETV